MRQQKYFNNNKPVNMLVRNRRDADRLIDSAFKCNLILTFAVLHEKYGWSTKRLEKFGELYHLYLENYNDGYLDVHKLEQKLFEETGIKIL